MCEYRSIPSQPPSVCSISPNKSALLLFPGRQRRYRRLLRLPGILVAPASCRLQGFRCQPTARRILRVAHPGAPFATSGPFRAFAAAILLPVENKILILSAAKSFSSAPSHSLKPETPAPASPPYSSIPPTPPRSAPAMAPTQFPSPYQRCVHLLVARPP